MQKAHFLVAIQLPILDAYHGRISSSLVAFETLSSIFVRAVPGALNFSTRETFANQDDPRNRTSGTAGANSLCKALLSASYIEACLEEWGEDVVGEYPSFVSGFLKVFVPVFRDPVGGVRHRFGAAQMGTTKPSFTQARCHIPSRYHLL